MGGAKTISPVGYMFPPGCKLCYPGEQISTPLDRENIGTLWKFSVSGHFGSYEKATGKLPQFDPIHPSLLENSSNLFFLVEPPKIFHFKDSADSFRKCEVTLSLHMIYKS